MGAVHHIALYHHAPCRGSQLHGLAHLPGLFQPFDFRRGNIPVEQPFAGGCQQRFPALTHRFEAAGADQLLCFQRQDVFFLGGDQVRRIDLQQGAAFLHDFPGVIHVKVFNPAGNFGIDIIQLIFIEIDLPNSSDRTGKIHPHHLAVAHPHILHRHRVDGNGSAGAGRFFAFIHRHQIHAHLRFAGAVVDLGGIHWCPPVEDLAVGLRTFRSGSFRRLAAGLLHRHQLHPALGAIPRLIYDHLRVHPAGPELPACRPSRGLRSFLRFLSTAGNQHCAG